MRLLSLIILITLLSCSVENTQKTKKLQLIDAVIIGSAESPDPVLQRVIELKKNGTISNVAIMESFPVKIRLKATQNIINELEAIPRVKLLKPQ